MLKLNYIIVALIALIVFIVATYTIVQLQWDLKFVRRSYDDLVKNCYEGTALRDAKIDALTAELERLRRQ